MGPGSTEKVLASGRVEPPGEREGKVPPRRTPTRRGAGTPSLSGALPDAGGAGPTGEKKSRGLPTRDNSAPNSHASAARALEDFATDALYCERVPPPSTSHAVPTVLSDYGGRAAAQRGSDVAYRGARGFRG